MANQVRNFFSRNFSTFNHLRASLSEPLKKSEMTTHDHEIRTLEMWKKLFIFGCIPAIVVAYLNATMGEEPKRPEFVNYPHLRIRTKPFPWGDGNKSLFHNPHVNALPTGYESDHH